MVTSVVNHKDDNEGPIRKGELVTITYRSQNTVFLVSRTAFVEYGPTSYYLTTLAVGDDDPEEKPILTVGTSVESDEKSLKRFYGSVTLKQE